MKLSGTDKIPLKWVQHLQQLTLDKMLPAIETSDLFDV
jgi:hypothetical protein